MSAREKAINRIASALESQQARAVSEANQALFNAGVETVTVTVAAEAEPFHVRAEKLYDDALASLAQERVLAKLEGIPRLYATL